jgi:hypothetical protein
MGMTDVNHNITVVHDAITGTGRHAIAVLEAATGLTGQADVLTAEVSISPRRCGMRRSLGSFHEQIDALTTGFGSGETMEMTASR